MGADFFEVGYYAAWVTMFGVVFGLPLLVLAVTRAVETNKKLAETNRLLAETLKRLEEQGEAD